jgi:hypothetical protein
MFERWIVDGMLINSDVDAAGIDVGVEEIGTPDEVDTTTVVLSGRGRHKRHD